MRNFTIGLNPGAMSDDDAKAKALDALQAIRFRGDGYFTIFDTAGVNLMHPFRKDLVGKNIIEAKDPAGKTFFVKDLLAANAKGGGFVDFMWIKPGEKGNRPPSLASPPPSRPGTGCSLRAFM